MAANAGNFSVLHKPDEGLMEWRRRLLVLSGTAALLAATTALPQSTAVKRRVGYLAVSSPSTSGHLFALFVAGLRDLGWIEGDNLSVDARWAGGDTTQWAPLAAELLALRPDVLVTSTDESATALAAATKAVPIVFVSGGDPLGRGLVKSLALPGGNVTGLSSSGDEIGPKRLALLKEALPNLKTVGVFTDAYFLDTAALTDAARRLGVELILAEINRPSDVDRALDTVAKAGAGGAVDRTNGGTTFLMQEIIVKWALQHRIAFVGHSAIANSGVLMSYGVTFATLFSRAAGLVDRILKGANPAVIPVEQVNVFELVVNRRTAQALGLELPRSILLQAAHVIE